MVVAGVLVGLLDVVPWSCWSTTAGVVVAHPRGVVVRNKRTIQSASHPAGGGRGPRWVGG